MRKWIIAGLLTTVTGLFMLLLGISLGTISTEELRAELIAEQIMAERRRPALLNMSGCLYGVDARVMRFILSIDYTESVSQILIGLRACESALDHLGFELNDDDATDILLSEVRLMFYGYKETVGDLLTLEIMARNSEELGMTIYDIISLVCVLFHY